MTDIVIEELESVLFNIEHIISEGIPAIRDEAIESKVKIKMVIKILENMRENNISKIGESNNGY